MHLIDGVSCQSMVNIFAHYNYLIICYISAY